MPHFRVEVARATPHPQCQFLLNILAVGRAEAGLAYQLFGLPADLPPDLSIEGVRLPSPCDHVRSPGTVGRLVAWATGRSHEGPKDHGRRGVL